MVVCFLEQIRRHARFTCRRTRLSCVRWTTCHLLPTDRSTVTPRYALMAVIGSLSELTVRYPVAVISGQGLIDLSSPTTGLAF